jgi:hypothetical protein
VIVRRNAKNRELCPFHGENRGSIPLGRAKANGYRPRYRCSRSSLEASRTSIEPTAGAVARHLPDCRDAVFYIDSGKVKFAVGKEAVVAIMPEPYPVEISTAGRRNVAMIIARHLANGVATRLGWSGLCGGIKRSRIDRVPSGRLFPYCLSPFARL